MKESRIDLIKLKCKLFGVSLIYYSCENCKHCEYFYTYNICLKRNKLKKYKYKFYIKGDQILDKGNNHECIEACDELEFKEDVEDCHELEFNEDTFRKYLNNGK